MNSVKRHELNITGAAGATFDDVPELRGYIESIVYEPDGTAPYAAASTFAVTIIRPGFTSETILTGIALDAGAKVLRPRVPVHDSAGAAVAGVVDRVAIAYEKIRVTVTAGGAAKTGKFVITLNL